MPYYPELNFSGNFYLTIFSLQSYIYEFVIFSLGFAHLRNTNSTTGSLTRESACLLDAERRDRNG